MSWYDRQAGTVVETRLGLMEMDIRPCVDGNFC